MPCRSPWRYANAYRSMEECDIKKIANWFRKALLGSRKDVIYRELVLHQDFKDYWLGTQKTIGRDFVDFDTLINIAKYLATSELRSLDNNTIDVNAINKLDDEVEEDEPAPLTPFQSSKFTKAFSFHRLYVSH